MINETFNTEHNTTTINGVTVIDGAYTGAFALMLAGAARIIEQAFLALFVHQGGDERTLVVCVGDRAGRSREIGRLCYVPMDDSWIVYVRQFNIRSWSFDWAWSRTRLHPRLAVEDLLMYVAGRD